MPKTLRPLAIILMAAALAVPGDVVAVAPTPDSSTAAALAASEPAPVPPLSGSALAVILQSGWIGRAIWLGLLGALGVGVYGIVDASLILRRRLLVPDALVRRVSQATAAGRLLEALRHCEEEPGPLASVITAGLARGESGAAAAREAAHAAAEREIEALLRPLARLALIAYLAPLLGLLGTVAAMVAGFASVAPGIPDRGALALAIAQALYVTAAGIAVAIPCAVAAFGFGQVVRSALARAEDVAVDLVKGVPGAPRP